MAMAQGTNDNIEDILGKLGIGTLSGNSFLNPMGEHGPELDIYDYTGTATTAGSVAHLLSNMDEMRKVPHHLLPCKAGMPTEINTMLQDQTILANIRRYVSEGGKLYVTTGPARSRTARSRSRSSSATAARTPMAPMIRSRSPGR